MRRREFITLLGGAAAAWPVAASAQQGEQMRRIGVLLPATADDTEYQVWMRTFLQGLGESGWTVGLNLQVDTHWAGANVDVIRRKAVELVASAPDVILAHGNGPVSALLQATRIVPIVFPIAGDSVGTGLANSLARPGGNATGFAQFEFSLSGKWLELLKQIAPNVTRAAILRDAGLGTGTSQFAAIQDGADAQGGGQSDQHARCGRDRAIRGHVCASPGWRLNTDSERFGTTSSRPHHFACGAAQIARYLLRTLLCCSRWAHVLRD
jgi:putative ABC transport system substrate-binding protein